MDYYTYAFRHADVLLKEPEYINEYNEIIQIIKNIDEDEVYNKHLSYGKIDISKTPKSLSIAINELLKQKFKKQLWHSESKIFQDTKYTGDTWRLDFAKKTISIEVGFNHSSVIAWNLIKPVLASELNHVHKAIQTNIGVIITVTDDFKKKGGFDGAIGTFEKYIEYLAPLRNLLTTPILIIGLKAPSSFYVQQIELEKRKKIGKLIKY